MEKTKKKSICLLVMDVDGTLTDGKIYYTNSGEEMKAFNIHDGYGIAQMLPKHDIEAAIITGRASEIVRRRAEELSVKYIFQGVHNKLECLTMLAEELRLSLDNIAFIGDDMNDLECMEACGIAGCPADAVEGIKDVVDFLAKKRGGEGAAREFIDWLINQKSL